MLLTWSRLIVCSHMWSSVVVSIYFKGTSTRMRKKMMKMNTELVQDAAAKIRSVQHFREKNYRSPAYQVGDVTCNVQTLLGGIVKLYKQIELNNITDEELLVKFEEVHNRWFSVENLILMIEHWEKREPGRRSGSYLNIGGIKESKRWTALEEGERLESVRFSSIRSSKKKKIWHFGKRDQSQNGF